MERRMLFAVLLSFLVVFLWSMFTAKQQQEANKDNPLTDESTETPGENVPGPSGETSPVPDDVPDTPSPAVAGPAEAPAPASDQVDPQASYTTDALRTVVESTELEVGFTAQGGAVEFVRLRRAFEADHTTPLDLIVPLDPFFLLGQIDDGTGAPGQAPRLGPVDGAPGGGDRREDPVGRLRKYLWTRDGAAETATEENDVVYRCTTADEIWTKRWIVADGEGRFDIQLRISRQALAGATPGPATIKVLAAAGLLREPATGAAFQYPNVALMRQGQMDQPAEPPYGVDVTSGADAAMLRLLGARSHYYMGVFYTDKERPTAPPIKRFWATGEASDMREGMMDHVVEYFQ